MATYEDRFLHICKEFDVGFRNGKTNHLIRNRWYCIAQNMKDERFTLLIGAGVTSNIVGQWNELLNEVAIQRVLSDNENMKSLTVDKLRTFIATSKGMHGTFLPTETDVLEKGEYLKQDSGDCVGSGSPATDKEEVTREVAFAHRVLTAIETLTKKKLRGKDYIKDFLAWKKNRANIIEGFPKLKRKEIVYACAGEDADAISSEGKKRLPLAAILNNNKKYPLQKLTFGFYQWLCINEIYFTYEQKKSFASFLARMLLANGKRNFNDSALPGDTEETVAEDLMHRAAVELADELNKYVGKGVIDVKCRECLCKLIAEAIWLPDYGTLDALLELCLKGAFSRVLTYNFDTIFDHLLANDDVQKAYKITQPVKVKVYGIHDTNALNLPGFYDKTESDNHVIKIYHVHGVLDVSMCKSRDVEKQDDSVDNKLKIPLIDPIIFSGSSYSSYQSNHFNLGSLRIADAVNEGSLLCVGFSGVDANFRSIQSELIHSRNRVLSLQDYKRHNVYITRSLKQDRKCFDMLKSEKDIDTAYACLRSHMNMLRDYFEDVVGAKLVWAENFEAMAALLRELKK